ncbi:SusE domain-containing protein [Flavobacterium sp. MK4S-17]|jgi:hypothetical protein|uniref:SusE domain-containing protein n=1 Tax=Flavobacterium sp. MK4S-17 TaxID=2543737 RepID=UPI00135C5D62|nr:SusE domain-containing protein [Flavobacterium sp. MK4S-17]
MKNIFKALTAIALFAGFTSCEDEQDLKYLNPPAATFSILSPESGSSVILDPLTPNNPALVLTWEDVDYGSPTEVTYTVQIAAPDTEFAEPIELASTTNTYVTINSQALNGAAVAAGLEPFTEGAVEVRIKSNVGTTGAEPSFSNSIVYLVTPYVTYPYKDLYLIGEATEFGWDNTGNENHHAMFRDPANENVYYYTGYFAAGEFKLIEKKGNWQPQWGVNGGSLAVNDGTGSDPGPFIVATAGYYTLMVNTADMAYTFESFNEAGSSTYTTIAIIGTATPNDWNDPDTDMVQSAFDPHIWYLESQFLKAGDSKLKFRANDSWTVNWGGDTSYSGLGAINGGDIPIGITIPGNYEIWFNDLTGRYIYIPVE